MTSDLAALTILPLTGAEPFLHNGAPLPQNLSHFWCWYLSDIVNNATRGVLAEYIVAMALGCDLGKSRTEWAAYDLMTPSGLKIEVKSAAYLQSWGQKKLSNIIFQAPRTFAMDGEGNLAKESKRQADVYVFALLAHQDKETVNPLNLDQWRFYVATTARLEARKGGQKSLTLKGLAGLAEGPLEFGKLKDAVGDML